MDDADALAIRLRAEAEVREELRRQAVEKEKARILARLRSPWWHKLLPFTITVHWRNK